MTAALRLFILRFDALRFRRLCSRMPFLRLASAFPATCLCIVAMLWTASPASAQAALERLSVRSGNAVHVFEVEVARTGEERAKGLMFRRYLPADRGMLFDFGAEQPVAMWMKDTFIPLDMLFIRKDGTIARIAENTEPHSLRSISSGENVLSVLELNGGTAARLGIAPGDRVMHPLFGTRP